MADKDEHAKKTPIRKRVQKKAPRKGVRRPARKTRTATRKEEAEQQIAASASLAYLSKSDLRRHIHEGLKPYQHLADQAGLHFLSYLIAMAVEESGSDSDKKRAREQGEP